MEKEQKNLSKVWNNVFWILWCIFLGLSILNFIYVHAVPGIFYLVLSFVFLPPLGSFLKKKLGFSIHPLVWLIIALVVLWATLAVGDLMEMFEDQIPNL